MQLVNNNEHDEGGGMQAIKEEVKDVRCSERKWSVFR